MNVIINKSDKIVIWINSDPNKLPPNKIYGNYDATTMQSVFCPGYVPEIGKVFKPTIAGDTILEFQPKTVWSKGSLGQSRELKNWNGTIKETETEIEPEFNTVEDRKVYKQFQSFENGAWLVDTIAEAKADKDKFNAPIISEIKILEQKIIRPMIAKTEGVASQDDIDTFDDLKTQIETLRGQIIK